MAHNGDHQADIAELRTLLQASSRPRVQDILRRELKILEECSSPEPQPTTAARLAAAVAAPAATTTDDATSAPAASAPAASKHNVAAESKAAATVAVAPPTAAPVLLQSGKAPAQRHYNPMSTFSWDQDSEKIKIYFFLTGASKETVELDVKPASVDLRMHDVGSNGRNLRFGVPLLHKEIDPGASKVVVKPDRVTVVLRKKERGHWLDLHFKEDKLKPKPEGGKDPMAGVMDLMKNMYDEGDEDMKRTIAKAWSDAQSGKANNPMMPGGF